VYLFDAVIGRSRILEPIILGAAEAPPDQLTWSPLRTCATFYSAQETGLVHAELTLVCPRTTIQGDIGAAFPVRGGFPKIVPPFNSSTTSIVGRVYDTHEVPLRDVSITCDCLTQIALLAIDPIYSAPEASLGTYTELEVQDPNPTTGLTTGTFTGYWSSLTTGSAVNNYFGRLSNGSRDSMRGPVAVHTR